MNSSSTLHTALLATIAVAIVGMFFISTGNAEASTQKYNLVRGDMTTSASSTKSRALNTTCMSTAVEKRETALITAWSEFNNSVAEALADRKTDLMAAWTQTEVTKRSSALKTAWADWKTAKKSAHAEFKNDRKVAWETFKATAKNECKVPVPKEESLEKTEKDSVSI